MYGLNIDPSNPAGNPSVAELKSLGVQTVRFNFKDSSTGSQPDPQRVQFYRDKVQAYADAGIKSLIILTGETRAGAPGVFPAPDAVWDTYITLFAERAAQLAEIFVPWQPVLQVWNEPDLPPHDGYIPTMYEQQYARMLQRTTAAIKAVDATLPVSTAGLASGHPTWLDRVIQALGGPLPADMVAIHPYDRQPTRDWPTPDYGVGFVGDFLNEYRQFTSLPLIISECGDRHLSAEGQAEYLLRFYNTMATDFAGVVNEVYWYCYSDGMIPPFGLLTASGQRKPAYTAYQDLATHNLADTIVTRVAPTQTSIIEGTPVRFEATVQNIGTAATGDIVGVAFLVDGTYITFGTTSPITPGESRLLRAVTTWTATRGQHTLTAVADDINRYPEISESNNTLQTTFQVQPQPAPALSDVVVRDIGFERDATGRVRLAALVANEGQATTTDIVGVAFFIDNKYVTFGVIAPLAAGATKAVRADQTFLMTGVNKITALVDDINRFPESNETNNSLTKQIDFGGTTPALADTVVIEATAGSGRLTEGDQLTFEATVRNIGTATTGDIVGVAFLVDGQYITFGSTTPIPAGETRTVRAVSTWRATAGQHRLTAVADDINRYPEISEANNRFERTFEVFKPDQAALPDSAVTAIGFEKTSSGLVILTATVANIGTVATPDVVGVAFFVDGVYRTFGIVSPMAPNTTTVIRAGQALPLQGRHIILAIVDDINRYEELSHQNNALTREVDFS